MEFIANKIYADTRSARDETPRSVHVVTLPDKNRKRLKELAK